MSNACFLCGQLIENLIHVGIIVVKELPALVTSYWHVCSVGYWFAEVAMARSWVTLLICFSLLVNFSCGVNGHSLEVEYNPERPLSRMQLHRQLTALNSAVNISVTPDLLGAKVGSFLIVWITGLLCQSFFIRIFLLGLNCNDAVLYCSWGELMWIGGIWCPTAGRVEWVGHCDLLKDQGCCCWRLHCCVLPSQVWVGFINRFAVSFVFTVSTSTLCCSIERPTVST